MKTVSALAMAGILAWVPVASSQGRGWGGCGGCPAGGFPASALTELHGTITAVQLAPGAGTPSVTIHQNDQDIVVYLGSMRYLMEQGFSPKAGEEITAKAYQANGRYFAASVTLPSENQTIRLRDENGRPLWRGGPRRGGHRWH